MYSPLLYDCESLESIMFPSDPPEDNGVFGDHIPIAMESLWDLVLICSTIDPSLLLATLFFQAILQSALPSKHLLISVLLANIFFHWVESIDGLWTIPWMDLSFIYLLLTHLDRIE